MRNASYGPGAVLAIMAAVTLLAVGACNQAVAEELHILYHHHDILDDGTIVDSASGCLDIDVSEDDEVMFDDPFLEEGGSAELSIERVLTRHGLRVTGVSENQGNQVLMERLYSPDFIRSGFTDIAEIQAPSRRYQIAHRGAQTCDAPFELISK